MHKLRLGVVGVLGVLLSACGGQASNANPSGKNASGGSSATDTAEEGGSAATGTATQGGSTASSGAAPGTLPGASGGLALAAGGTFGAGGAMPFPTGIIGTGATSTGTMIAFGGMMSIRTPIPFFPGGSGSTTAPVPVNCQPVVGAVAVDNCQTELSCDNDHIFTSCYAQGNGTWYCSCSGSYTYLSYGVTGGDSSSTCKAVSELCSSGKQPEFTASAGCSVASEYSGLGYCELQQLCTQSAEIAPGITAQIQDQKYVSCNDQGGQSLCDCNGNTASKSFRLSSAITAGSCRTVADLCGQNVVFAGTPTCQPSYQVVGTGTCELQQECSTATPVSDTVTALLYDWQSAQCQDLKNGSSACTCSDNQGSLRFDMPSAATNLGTCTSAQGVCAAVDDLLLADPVTCETNYQSASTQMCDAQLSCSQTATQGDRQLVVYGDLYVSCQLQTTGSPWSCMCSSGFNQATVKIDGTSGWSVCTTAVQRCPELVAVAIGSSSFPGPFPAGGIMPL